MDKEQEAARDKLRSKGNEAVPALFLLFQKNSDDNYRTHIIDALKSNKDLERSRDPVPGKPLVLLQGRML